MKCNSCSQYKICRYSEWMTQTKDQLLQMSDGRITIDIYCPYYSPDVEVLGELQEDKNEEKK